MKGALVAQRLQKSKATNKGKAENGFRNHHERYNESRFDPPARSSIHSDRGSMDNQLRATPAEGNASPLIRMSSRNHANRIQESSDTVIEDLAGAADDDESGDTLLHGLATNLPFKKWEKLTSGLLQRCNWSRLGDFAKALSKLPDDVELLYEKCEKESGVTFDGPTRLKFYKEFVRSALGASVLRIDEVEKSRARPREFLTWPLPETA